jgi:hypothetical protein
VASPPAPPRLSESGNRLVRRRKRKNLEQMAFLAAQFHLDNGDWTKERLAFLSKQTGLSEGQIYKWGWDQKKKVQDIAAAPSKPEAPQAQQASQPEKKREVKRDRKESHEDVKSCKIRLDFNQAAEEEE